MNLLIIGLTAAMASWLTLFTGFGLGTLLTPIFILFFPVPVAVSLTAMVHFLNNLFKLVLVGRFADREIVFKFGFPAIAAAFAGALALGGLARVHPLAAYSLAGFHAEVSILKMVISGLLIFFALADIFPFLERFQFTKKHLVLGGFLSGFFGGLSGHQGALRSSFLIRCNLSKQVFIGTGVVIACLIDASRLTVYGWETLPMLTGEHLPVILTAVLSAFSGAWLASKHTEKIKTETIQTLVSIMLILIAIGLAVGLI